MPLPIQAISDTIVALQEHFERVRLGEIVRFRPRLGSLSADQKDILESLTRGIVNEIMHAPMTALNAAARDQDPSPLVVLTRRAFGLGERARPTPHRGLAEEPRGRGL
jgi:glutamyl-tRNA reductase